MQKKTIEKEFRQIIEEENPYLGREGLVYTRVSSKKQEIDGPHYESTDQQIICRLEYIEALCRDVLS
jgi:hypothetical protein